MSKKYLLDSNILINAHNLHYHPSFCEKFWDWLNSAHTHNYFFSIDTVHKELIKPKDSHDELSNALRNNVLPSNFFLDSLKDKNVAANYGKLIAWSLAHPRYNAVAQKEFALLDKADASLIAVAMTYGYTIVTAEKPSPSIKRIMIPDAASAHHVDCISVELLLRRHAKDNFTFNP